MILTGVQPFFRAGGSRLTGERCSARTGIGFDLDDRFRVPLKLGNVIAMGLLNERSQADLHEAEQLSRGRIASTFVAIRMQFHPLRCLKQLLDEEMRL